MTTYVYETIPNHENEEPQLFEIKQSMNDEPLTHHPETGQAIRRVILGGYGLMTAKATPSRPSGPSGGSCGSGCGCC
jgi:predicted nucleic acid-binding Zn ribbon protein